MGPPAKLRLVRQLKKIQSDLKTGVKKVLSEDQMKAWEKYRQEQQKKGK